MATTLGAGSVAAVSPYVQGLLDRMRDAGVDTSTSAPTEAQKARNVLGMGNLHVGSQNPGGVGLAAIVGLMVVALFNDLSRLLGG